MRCQHLVDEEQCPNNTETGMSVCAEHNAIFVDPPKEETALATVEPAAVEVQKSETLVQPVSPLTGDMVVFAKNPVEMEAAQGALTHWARLKIYEQQVELEDLETNLELAKKNKWKSTPWKTRITRTRKRLEFYEKVEQAFLAGYCLVPNFEGVDIFAVRTNKKKPPSSSNRFQHSVPDVESNSPASGEGRYVDPAPFSKATRVPVLKSDGTEASEIRHFPVKFDEVVDFPFGFAKPQVLDAAGKAMAKKLFDDMGVLPQRSRRGDPVVVGRIRRKEGYNVTEMTFLISWFIDTRQL